MVSEKGVKKKGNSYYYTEQVISEFSSSFSVINISCLTHVETIFDFAPRVHKHNFSHRCNHLCYALSQSSKICNIFPDRRYPSHNPSGRSPVVLCLVILWTILGNSLFQSTCSESVRLKTDGHCFQNVAALQPAGTMNHKVTVVLCGVLTRPDTNGLSRLLSERKEGPMIPSFIKPHLWRLPLIDNLSDAVDYQKFCSHVFSRHH
jgi:hypothetical protein